MTSWSQTIERLFVQPERLVWLWLIAGLVLIIIIGGLLRARWRRRLFALARDQHAAEPGKRWRWLLTGVRATALLLIVLALADPRAGLGAIEVKLSKLQIVCLLDRSRSMMARDVPPSRFEAGANVIRDVVDSAGGAAVALATFAGDTQIDVPLTRDYEGLLVRLDEIAPDNNQTTGSNLGAGLVTAAACFAERIESPKILIVITDGETHGVEPELPDGMLPAGTEVLVLGVGDPQEGARIPVSEGEASGSNDDEYLTYEGKTVWSKANPDLLIRLVERLNGSFHKMEAGSSTTAIFDVVRRAESTAAENARLAYRRQAAPRFHWLLLAAVGLLCLEMMLPLWKQMKFSTLHRARSGLVKHLVLLLCSSVWTLSVALANEPPGTAVASQWTSRELSQLYNRGVEAYRTGRWSDAESLFRTVSRQAKGPLQTKAMFNLANTHYAIVNRGGISKREAISRLEGAIDLFRQVIAEGERAEDARANIEIVYRHLLQIQQQQPDSQDDEPSPADEPPGNGDGARDEADDNGTNGDRERDGDQSDSRDSGDQPPGSDRPADDNGQRPGKPDVGARSGSGPSGAGRPPADPTEPLTDQQAEDQLRRIRQRAQDRRKEGDQGETADAAPLSAPPGLPW